MDARVRRTVDGNGHGLGEDVAIGTLKGRDLSELVELEVLGRDTLGRLSVNNLKVKVVGLSNCADGSAAGVTLLDKKKKSQLCVNIFWAV